MAKGKYKLHFDREKCKACGICIAFCPTNVFTVDIDYRAVVSSPDKCTGCKRCELYCPDYCIFVEEDYYG